MNKSPWLRWVGILAVVFLSAMPTMSTANSQPEQAPAASPAETAGRVSILSGPNEGDPLDIALAYLREHCRELGLVEDDLAELLVVDRYTSDHNGVTHIYFKQRFNGIEVYNAIINVNVAADGSVISVGNRLVGSLAKQIVGASPGMAADRALRAAARALKIPVGVPIVLQKELGGAAQGKVFSGAGISLDPITVQLMYQPVADGSVRLAWDLGIYELDAQNWWSMRVDASTGEELDRANLVDHDTFGPREGGSGGAGTGSGIAAKPVAQAAGGSYNVYPAPVESPNHGNQTLVYSPADPIASQFGWHDSTVTQGNNVNAYLDTDHNNVPDPGGQPDGGAFLTFTFPIDLGLEPATYQDAAVTNLFYWNNLLHDVLYHYGFNEASGNFQENNYGSGGLGSDSVNAEAQDGGGENNADFATPPDSGNPRMQMYIWKYTNPWRDGDLDNGIVAHEYGHGVSNRLTGGPSNVYCLDNFEQPGEGWSDYIALIFTMESGDTGADRRGVGTYALGQPTDGTGIRAYPYSTLMGIDPRTYDDIKSAAVPHGVGSVWAAMLWEMTWSLIDRYGFDPDLVGGTGGNNIALQLVMDGMKLQPCSPGFVDARDAILQADQINNWGANQCLIWEAFAKRGLGFSADQGHPNSRTDGTEAFDLPPECTMVTVAQSADPSPVEAGAVLTHNLLVDNRLSEDRTNVTVTDDVPPDTNYVHGSATCSGTLQGGTVTFPLGDVPPKTSRSCSFQVTVANDLGTVVHFFDDMESGSGKWSTSHGEGTLDWSLVDSKSHSPSHAWFAADPDTITDQYLVLGSPVTLGDAAELRFWHIYSLEPTSDGGVVEISVDGGGSWADLGSLMTQNGYDATISTRFGSPIGGRQAFTGSKADWVETIVDLSSYPDQDVLIRFRLASDFSLAWPGWYVDDVELIDEDRVTNTACVTADQGDNHCHTIETMVMQSDNQAPTAVAEAVPTNGFAPLEVQFTGSNSSGADGSVLSYYWDFGDGDTSTEPDPLHTYTETGVYMAILRVTDDGGLIDTDAVYITVDPPGVVKYEATGETPVAGTVSGSYVDTQANDGVAESIEEIESGGKPDKRHTYLEHKWTFSVPPGGLSTILYANAWAPASTDDDKFEFYYSTDDETYERMFTVAASDDDGSYQTFDLSGKSGTIYVQVVDTDRTSGHRDKDTVYVDHLYIRTDNTPPQPPAAPSGLSATAVSGSQINLSWADNADNEQGF